MSTEEQPPPEQASADPAQASADPAQAGADPAQAGADPAQASADPAQAGADPAQAGADPAQAGADPAQAGADPAQAQWLLLVYRIPSEPTRLRAGVWRKIKGLGAIYVQSSVAALPASPAAERALRSLRAEIADLGGVAYVFDSTLLVGQAQLVGVFNQARDDEYEEIVDRCDDFLRQVRKEYDADHFTYAELEENDVDLAKLKGWLEKVRSRDVLGAAGYDAAVTALAECERALEDYAARVYAEEGEDPRLA